VGGAVKNFQDTQSGQPPFRREVGDFRGEHRPRHRFDQWLVGGLGQCHSQWQLPALLFVPRGLLAVGQMVGAHPEIAHHGRVAHRRQLGERDQSAKPRIDRLLALVDEFVRQQCGSQARVQQARHLEEQAVRTAEIDR